MWETEREPTHFIKRQVNKNVKKAQKEGTINKKEAKYLIPEAPKISIINQVPKIHKDAKTPPERPIIGGVESIFSGVGEYLDHYLQPLAQKYPSYIKDSRDLINQINKSLQIGHGLWVIVILESPRPSQAQLSCRRMLIIC